VVCRLEHLQLGVVLKTLAGWCGQIRRVQHSFTWTWSSRSDSLPFNAYGDCALYGNRFGSYKARLGNRKPRPLWGRKVDRGEV